MRFSSKDPEEKKTLTFDFTEDLTDDNGVLIRTIVPGSVVFNIAVSNGVDANPALLLNGASAIVGPVVLQGAKVGIDKNDYEFRCHVDDNTGQHHIITCTLPIRRGA